MHKFLAIIALLPFLVASFPHGDEAPWMELFAGAKIEEAEPKPCCFPETWEGFVESDVAEVSSKHKHGDYRVSKTKVSIDGKKMAGTMYCRKSGKAVGGFVGLYNTSGLGFKIYIFSKMDTRKCYSFESLRAKYEPTCIPEEAKYKGTFDMGLSGSGLTVNSFSFYKKGHSSTLMGNAVVTKDCIPIVYREAGKIGGCSEDQSPNENLLFAQEEDEALRCGGKKFVVNAYFHDLAGAIKDPSVFDLPDACKRRPTAMAMGTDQLGDEEFQDGYEQISNFLNYVLM